MVVQHLALADRAGRGAAAFGTKRLRGAGRDLGEAVKGFKKGMADDDRPAGELDHQSQPERREDTVSGKPRQDDTISR